MVNRDLISFAIYLDLFIAMAIASHYTVCNTPKHIDLACLSQIELHCNAYRSPCDNSIKGRQSEYM